MDKNVRPNFIAWIRPAIGEHTAKLWPNIPADMEPTKEDHDAEKLFWEKPEVRQDSIESCMGAP